MQRRAIPNNRTPVRAGLSAGSIAGVAAALVNLPLHAPTDTLFNAGSVVFASLVTGLIVGWLWLTWSHRPVPYVGALVTAFIVVLAAAIVAQGALGLDRAVSYIVPLAALVLAGTGVLTPVLARLELRTATLTTFGLLAVAIAVGALLANQGDAASGQLQLPPRSANEIQLT